MSVVIPFGQCKARPDEGGHQFWLESHLVAVAQGWGKVDGSYNERLCFLGGLCHDAAKGRKKWQDNLLGPKGSRPPHAAPGALLFSYYAAKLLDLWKEQDRLDRNQMQILRAFVVRVVRDIYDHHRELGDIEEEVPWLHMPEKDLRLHDLDLAGFHRFVCRYFSTLADFDEPLSQTLEEWKKTFKRKWSRWSNMSRIIPKLCAGSSLERTDVEKELCIRDDTASFISADRIDAAQISRVNLEPESARLAITRLDTYCRERAEALLTDNPGAQEIVNKKSDCTSRVPGTVYQSTWGTVLYIKSSTGLGKTLTSLRIALESCKNGRCNRIYMLLRIYRYFRRLQNEIRNATELEVLQHHHLSMLSEGDFDDKDILIESCRHRQLPPRLTNCLELYFPTAPKNWCECLLLIRLL